MATESFKIFGIVDLEGGEKVLQSLERIGEKAEATGERMQAIGEGLASVGSTLTIGVTVPLAFVGGKMLETAMDANEMRSQFKVIFGEMTEDMKEWANKYAETTRQSKVQTQGMLADIALMGRTAGLTSTDLTNFATSIMTLSGDVAAFRNVELKEVVEGFSSAFKGSGEILDNFGITVDASTMQLYAQSKGLKENWSELDRVTKNTLILEKAQQDASVMMGYAAAEADSAKGKWRGLKGDIYDLGEEIGQHLIPHFENVVEKVQKVVDWFGTLSPTTQQIILVVAGLAAVMGPLIFTVGMLTMGLGALAAAEWAALAPIAIIVAAIGGLAAIIIYAWKTNENFREAVTNAWKHLQSFGHSVFPSIKQVGKDAFDAIKRSVDGVVQFMTGLINFVTGVFTLDWKRAFKGAADIIIGFKETLAGPFQWIEDRLVGTIKWFKDFLGFGDKVKKYEPPSFGGFNWFGAGVKGFAEGGVFPANQPRTVVMGDATVPEAAVPLSDTVLGKLGAMIAQHVSPQGNGGAIVHQQVQFNGVESEGEFKRKLDQANRALAWELQFI